MKRLVALVMIPLIFFTSCSTKDDQVHPFSRESGSGTRYVFVKEMGLVKDVHDTISQHISVTNSGVVMLSAVSGDKRAIGYVSAAVVNNSVKTVSINGIYPTEKTVKSGQYPLSRKFILVYYPARLDRQQKNFLQFLSSANAAELISDMGYIPCAHIENFQKESDNMKLVIAGSASVAPLMERLRNLYQPAKNCEIEIQQNDSTTGLSLLKNKTCDVAMISREIQDGELTEGYETMELAYDAIALIVHPDNKISDLTSEQICKIYSSDSIGWLDI